MKSQLLQPVKWIAKNKSCINQRPSSRRPGISCKSLSTSADTETSAAPRYFHLDDDLIRLRRLFHNEKSGASGSSNPASSATAAQIDWFVVSQLRQIVEKSRTRVIPRERPKISMASNIISSRWGTDERISPDNDQIQSLSQKLKIVLKQSKVLTGKDIDSWIKIHAAEEYLDLIILEILSSASADSLLVMQEYLSQNSPTSVEYCKALLKRAIEVHPHTKYTQVGGDEVILGCQFIDKYLKFARQFQQTVEGDMEVDDLILRLSSNSGTIEQAAEILKISFLSQNKLPSLPTIDSFISALSNSLIRDSSVTSSVDQREALNQLRKYKPLFSREHLSPAGIKFILDCASSTDEFYEVMELIDTSPHADMILSTCQPKILEIAVRCSLSADAFKSLSLAGARDEADLQSHLRAMAHMFGILMRFTECSEGITSFALDQCLLLTALLGNSSGMHRAIALRLQLRQKQPEPLPRPSEQVIERVLDCFPIADRPISVGKRRSTYISTANDSILSDPTRDRAILNHIRSLIDPKTDAVIYSHYIGALGRSKFVDLLVSEWEILKTELNSTSFGDFQDVILQVLAAFKTANVVDLGLKALETVLKISERSQSDHGYAVRIVNHVFDHDILPATSALKCVAKWLLTQPNSKWTQPEIEGLFSRLSMLNFHAVKLISDTVTQVRAGMDVEVSLINLSSVLQRYS